MTSGADLDPAPADSSGRTVLITRLLSALAVVLLAAAVALTLVIRAHRADRGGFEQARSDSLVAARQLLLNLDAISAPTIDADVKRVTDGATGDFKDSFIKAQPDLKKIVMANSTQSSGNIQSAGIVRADLDSSTVLVAVDRRVKDKSNPNGAVAHDRWQLAMEKHDGRWLVADLQPVS